MKQRRRGKKRKKMRFVFEGAAARYEQNKVREEKKARLDIGETADWRNDGRQGAEAIAKPGSRAFISLVSRRTIVAWLPSLVLPCWLCKQC